jgi:hypothetical protein
MADGEEIIKISPPFTAKEYPLFGSILRYHIIYNHTLEMFIGSMAAETVF